jgi:hypothetical protein
MVAVAGHDHEADVPIALAQVADDRSLPAVADCSRQLPPVGDAAVVEPDADAAAVTPVVPDLRTHRSRSAGYELFS